MDRCNGRRLIKKEAIRKNKTGKVSGGYIFKIYPLFVFRKMLLRAGRKMYPSGCKVKIDGKFNLCYIKYIQHVSKGEKNYGKE